MHGLIAIFYGIFLFKYQAKKIKHACQVFVNKEMVCLIFFFFLPTAIGALTSAYKKKIKLLEIIAI